MRSAMRSASRSLWVMNTMPLPAARSDSTMRKKSSISCGVSTAVGSSKTTISAWRNSTLMISTRCCRPTGSSSTSASGSTSRPYSWEIRRTSRCAARRSSAPPATVGSTPRTTFSATVNTGTSMKCWWTMPMPAAMASRGEVNVRATPSTRISPSSAWYSP